MLNYRFTILTKEDLWLCYFRNNATLYSTSTCIEEVISVFKKLYQFLISFKKLYQLYQLYQLY